MTDFSNVCNILGVLWLNYRDAVEFKDFIEFNDVGLPLAYLIDNELCEPTDEGTHYIKETWALFLDSLQLTDVGFADFDAVMELADN
jgi:hypothetical protein